MRSSALTCVSVFLSCQRSRTIALLGGLAWISLFSTPAWSRTILVDDAGNGEFLEIQPAIDAATDADVVLVRPGEYVITESLTFRGKSIRVIAETTGGAVVRRSSPPNALTAGVVTFERGESADAILEGFVLTGGSRLVGAGILFRSDSSPTVIDCTISGNSAAFGGGIYCVQSEPRLLGCTIVDNFASFGGGMYCRQASPQLMGCTIAGNAATQDAGGGLACEDNSSPRLTDCTISGNKGRGLYCFFNSSPTLEHCTVAGNAAEADGGGLFCQDASSVFLKSCIVWANAGGSIALAPRAQAEVSYSSVEGDRLWPGVGNTRTSPLFCGWDGGETDVADQQDLRQALRFELGLAMGSPCLGTGEGGSNMGAENGRCDDAGQESRLLRLAPGDYSLRGVNLAYSVSLRGAGEETTIVEGTLYGLRTGAILSGVTITGGQSGGIRLGDDEAPEIRDCRISGNTGAGIYLDGGAAPLVSDCAIAANTGPGISMTGTSAPLLSRVTFAGNSNHGVFCGGTSSPVFTDCVVRGNFGNGVFVQGSSSPTFAGCTIAHNKAFSGAALHCGQDSTPMLTDCRIIGNVARLGGAVYCRNDAQPTLLRCNLSGNAAENGGGAFFCQDRSSLRLENCVLFANQALRLGGAGSCQGSSSVALIHSTVTENIASLESGGLYGTDDSSLQLVNCIVWRNRGAPFLLEANADLQATYSCLDALWPGEGNIVAEPLLMNQGRYDFTRAIVLEEAGEKRLFPDVVIDRPDFRPRKDSPVVDAGTPEAIVLTDLNGFVRPCGDGVEMGAYETGECHPFRFRRGDCDGDGDVAEGLPDAVFLLSFLFSGQVQPTCLAACDANGDGEVAGALEDVVYLLSFSFLGGPPPPVPFPVCGVARERDLALGCEASPEECR